VTARTLPLPATGRIALGGRDVTYTPRRSQRATRLRLRMLPSGLEVVLPPRATLREAESFIRQQAAWVLNALARLPEPTAPLADGSSLPCLDVVLTLRVRSGATSAVQRRGTDLLVTPAGMSLLGCLEAWYRAEARRYFVARVAVHVAALGTPHGRITIKDTRTRWGSCSSKGNLNFSWRLLLAPAAIADYVAAHEVAHLRELNHSAGFWDIVASLCPDYRRSRAWLRQHGPELAAWPG
jgi:predicted metal-dependent hydrolase